MLLSLVALWSGTGPSTFRFKLQFSRAANSASRFARQFDQPSKGVHLHAFDTIPLIGIYSRTVRKVATSDAYHFTSHTGAGSSRESLDFGLQETQPNQATNQQPTYQATTNQVKRGRSLGDMGLGDTPWLCPLTCLIPKKGNTCGEWPYNYIYISYTYLHSEHTHTHTHTCWGDDKQARPPENQKEQNLANRSSP